ncbi:glycosyltransferase family 2 protein [Flavobacterium oreochromis]|uniref:Glycosyltransferase 2-like domain-containing protein n=2 Tax=Flavobacterium TaxID=237 RepID=A0A246G9J4_9FLAO|nr:glycosyltransferase family 2 protein [Flavobacterium oreochromis]OWP74669.1 hypothetical protein BWG23_13300 [Flavobacterium oreochromis]OWP76304.1 hypothetical protein BWK62_09960 [Flavobacterium oreochromis]POR15720.1 hypothetical protein BWK58_15315 [Flavobacterium columnare]QYS86075.1 glycosyltransferase family 2 protein [Flavobacterium oreochromis]
MPFFSVIIPLYNKELYIKNTLQKVLAQSFQDFEIIIINDGSTDNSIKIVNSIIDSRIKLFHQVNKGVSSARNYGIKKASGTLVAFLDADDIWFDNHLAELYHLYQNTPNCGLYCSRYYMRINSTKVIPIEFPDPVNKVFCGIVPDYFESSLIHRISLTSAVCIPKEIFNLGYHYNINVNCDQDLELFTQIGIHYPVAITNKYTIEYNFNIENQLSKTLITQKTLCDFNQFKIYENSNSSLKKFLDTYRKEYGLHFKIAGNSIKAYEYFNSIDLNNMNTMYKILFKLPRVILVLLLNFKRNLRRKGIDFSIYNS